MLLRFLTAGLWAAVAATAWYWGFKLWVHSEPVPPHAVMAQDVLPKGGDLTPLLGAGSPAAEAAVAAVAIADPRLSLVGVVSPRGAQNAGQALALISIDGKPARTYRVGAVVDGGRVLQSVSLRGAKLGPRDGPAQLSLDIPLPAEAQRGFPGADAGGQAPSNVFLPGLSSLPGRSAPPAPGVSPGPGQSQAFTPPPPRGFVPSSRNPTPAVPMTTLQPGASSAEAQPGQNPALR